ncbi:MAG: hypothetical protein J2P57_06820 [Acidimicrobiaceae bacterium]|nr:hypothetical protein [Acidimicrobiaceae bacterium]
MTDVSASPTNLQAFVSQAKPANESLVTKINQLRQSYDEFQTSGSIPVANNALMNADLPALVSNQQTTDEFVTLTRQAFLTADSGGGAVATMPASSFQSAFDAAARAAGVDPQQVASIPSTLDIPPPKAGAIPADSGYVDDPVCTATGHFTELEQDFVVPPRLQTLAWQRVYSSRLLDRGAHGRGWWTWDAASLVRIGDTRADYRGPDGRRGSFVLEEEGGWQRLNGVEATLTETSDGLLLRWDAWSTSPLQEWTFGADGRLTTVRGPQIATCRFGYEGGRLARIEADGGRTLEVQWEGERIGALRLSDGRTVRYSYDADGDLIGVERAAGGCRYDVAGGLIVAVHDADGVRLCFNTYDEAGRVTRQVSPLGRETIVDYLPGRRTRISDTGDGPGALFEHDEIGRVVGITNAEGRSFRRVFAPDGQVESQINLDGSHLVRYPRADGVTMTLSGTSSETWHYDDRHRVIAHDRPGGRTTRFGYDGDLPLPSRIEQPGGGVLLFEYDERALLRRAVDADGLAMEFEYDSDGNTVAITDPLGGVSRIEVGPTGQWARVTHPDGATARLDHDDAGRLLGVTDQEGDQLRQEYSPAGRLTAVIDPRGARTSLEYASSGLLERIVDPLGNTSELRHNQLGSVVGITNPDGAKWELGWSLLGELSMVHSPDGGVRTFDHDPEGRLRAATDPLGRYQHVDYDLAGKVTTRVDAMGGVSRYDYDEAGNLVSVIGPTGAVTTLEWDLDDRLVGRTDPDGVRETRSYSLGGRLLEQTVGGVRRQLTYDEAGRLARVTTDDGSWTYRYDARHRLIEVRSPEGRATRYERDRAGRLTATVAGGARLSFAYDAAGNLVRSTDGRGHPTEFAYDLCGRLIAATDATGGRIEYRYDAMGNQVEMRDALGHAVRRAFDGMRQLVSVEDQLGRVTTFGYDLAGELRRIGSPTGEELTYERDLHGLVSDILVDGVNAVVYERDAAGRELLVHEPARDRTEASTWSPAGRLLGWTDGRREQQWRYDEAGRLAWKRNALGTEMSYRYGPAGNVTGVDSDTWGSLALDRDADGLLIGITGARTRRQWSYDADGRLTGYACEAGGDRTEVTLDHDADGRVVTVTDQAGRTVGYRYDPAGRLIATNEGAEEITWDYDAAGRRVAEHGPAGQRTWRYDDAHQLLEAEESGARTAFSYDAAGRRIVEQGPTRRRAYRWDALDRLVGVDDGDDRRDLEVNSRGQLLSAGDVELSWDPTGTVAEVATIGDESVLTIGGHLLAMSGPRGVRWTPTDWHGSPAGRGAWGGPAGPDVGIGYRSQVEVAGLVWLRARVYDPVSGQLLSPDPLAGVPGTAAGSFPYQYADDDPIGLMDPLGLRPVSVADFNKVRNAATGIQWGNIAGIAAGVAGGVLMMALMPESLGMAALIGAGIGAASGAMPGVVNGLTHKGWNWQSIVQGAVTGAVVGAVAGPIAKVLPSEGLEAVWKGAAAGVGEGALSYGTNEGYDAITWAAGWTGPPQFDPGNLGYDMVTGGVEGGAGSGIWAAKLHFKADAPEPVTPAEPQSPLIAARSTQFVTPVKPHLVVPPDPAGYTRSPSGLLVPRFEPVGPPAGWTHSPSGRLYVPSH